MFSNFSIPPPSGLFLLEAISKMQITFKDKSRGAAGVMCNIRKSAAYIGVCEHFEETCGSRQQNRNWALDVFLS
ncbi:MAG: hypothetical protein JSU83_19525 [Deltaproteobacteria bacterium]|nr:MAG: hypothetical protein JSU83_19525 [Deltaproteobacteria bacterium]